MEVIASILLTHKNNKMYPFDYNRHGQVQTGFDNSIDHSTFGHWRNPEYQEMCQSEEETQRLQSEIYIVDRSLCEDDGLPF